MRELLLIELALCAPGLIVAASVLLTRRRRSGVQPRMPVVQRRGAVAARTDPGMSRRKAADQSGFSHDAVARDPGTHVPAEPEQAAESQVSGVAGPQPEQQQAAVAAATGSGRIASYYDEADRPMADYLAARGWTEEPGTYDPW